MTDPLPADLQDLHAYVDGELPPEARQRVEAYLEQNPEAQERVRDYQRLQSAISGLYDPVLTEPLPSQLRGSRLRRRWELPLRSMAAGLLLLIGGTWAGWQLRDAAVLMMPSHTHVPQDAAMAYAVYTPEVRHPVEVPAEQEEHLVTWLSKRLNAQVRVPRLDTFGFHLMGGRLLASSDGPGALLMYETDEGRRMVLYLCENDLNGRSTAFRFSHEGGISVSYWFDGPFSYAVAGELDRLSLQNIAQVVYQAFEA